MHNKYLFIGCLLSILLSACSTSTETRPPQYNANFSESEYLIGVGDVLNISVWKNPDISVTVPVRPDGKVSVPLIGDVLSAGVEPEKLATTIADSLKTYIRTPKVTVIITQAGSTDYINRVRITGAVESPTSLPYRKGMTVLDLALLAGGANDFANTNKTKLYRIVDGKYQVFPIRLGDLLEKGQLDTNYKLSPSDVIMVPERSF